MIPNTLITGSVLSPEIPVNRVMSIVCPPREKSPHFAPGIFKKSPNNSIRLFLFNGVPSGAFLAPCILRMFEGVRSGSPSNQDFYIKTYCFFLIP